MKNFCVTITLLFFFTGLWAQHNAVFKESTPGYVNGSPPSTYINSCSIPNERVFTLKVLVNSADDEVTLKNVYFYNIWGATTGTTVVSPTSASTGTYNAGNSQIGKHIVFTIKTKDSYIPSFDCELRADWDYKDKVTTTDAQGNVTVETNIIKIRKRNLKNYRYSGIMTAPTLKGYPEKKQCGKEERISVTMKYENDLGNYSIRATNATVLTNTIVKSGSTCFPTLTFDLLSERCGDILFTIDRTNTAVNNPRSDSYLIKSEFDEVGTNKIESLNNGQTDFCVTNGPESVLLKGPFNEHFFGTDRPTMAQMDDLANACSEIEGTWSILSSTTPGGLSLATYGAGPSITFAYGFFRITQPGEYIVKYTLSACGKEVSKLLKLTACDVPPVLASVPPIDLQYICSLGEPVCAPIVNNGCFHKITTSTTDNKLVTTSYDENLCIGSIFPRTRTSQLDVTISNGCGSDQATWDIFIDYPEHCEENHERLKLEQGNQTLAVHLTSSKKEQEGLRNDVEMIEKVIIYDTSHQLIWSQNSSSADNRVLLPIDKLTHARTYVLQVITNKNTYNKHFIR